ncbi:unnamed protein product, partial [Discosporangium mesarthrocarpum]
EEELDEEALRGDAEVTGLCSVRNVEEAVEKFGYAPEDRIPRRDQIRIYERVHAAISRRKLKLVALGRYNELVELDKNLRNIKQGFQDLQLKDMSKDQERQRALYRAAQKKVVATSRSAAHSEHRRVEERCEDRLKEVEALHRVQQKRLELELSWLPKPRLKYTKRFLELHKAEASLVRLHQYSDAHTVHKMLNKLKPREEEVFLHEYQQKIALKRQQLAERQAKDLERVRETLTDNRLRSAREREKTMNVVRDKLKHSQSSMAHAHCMALKRRPELSVNPSAHWQRRTHYQGTSSALRGEQLSSSVK